MNVFMLAGMVDSGCDGPSTTEDFIRPSAYLFEEFDDISERQFEFIVVLWSVVVQDTDFASLR